MFDTVLEPAIKAPSAPIVALRAGRTPHQPGGKIRGGHRHAGKIRPVDAGVDEDAHHGHGEDQHEAGADQGAADSPAPARRGEGARLQQGGEQGAEYQQAARQVERLNGGATPSPKRSVKARLTDKRLALNAGLTRLATSKRASAT